MASAALFLWLFALGQGLLGVIRLHLPNEGLHARSFNPPKPTTPGKAIPFQFEMDAALQRGRLRCCNSQLLS